MSTGICREHKLSYVQREQQVSQRWRGEDREVATWREEAEQNLYEINRVKDLDGTSSSAT
eukprot:342588-Amphidinium_carterae.2